MKKFYRSLSVLCTAALILSLFCFISSADEYSDGNLLFYIDGSNAIITGTVSDVDGQLVVPDSVSVSRDVEKQVETTNEAGETELTTVTETETVSYSVTAIGTNAFASQNSMTSAVIASSVTQLGSSSFSGCNSLQSVSAPGVTAVPGSAFSGCSSLKSVSFGALRSIGAYSFAGTALSSYTIPSEVNSIGDGAFSNCSSLASVSFSGDCPSVGSDIFENTSSDFKVYIKDVAKGFDISETANGNTWNGYKVIVNAHTHQFGDYTVIVEPTCTEPGTKQRVCSICGAVETANIPALGHSWSEWQVDEELSKEKGSTWYMRVCTRCGAVQTADEATVKGTSGTVTPPTVTTPSGNDNNGSSTGVTLPTLPDYTVGDHEHVWGEWQLKSAATPTQPGVEVRECQICGLQEARTVIYSDSIKERAAKDFLIAALSDDGFPVYDTDGTKLCSISLVNIRTSIVESYYDFKQEDVDNLTKEAAGIVKSAVVGVCDDEDKDVFDSIINENSSLHCIPIKFADHESLNYRLYMTFVFNADQFASSDLSVYHYNRAEEKFEYTRPKVTVEDDKYIVTFSARYFCSFMVTDGKLATNGNVTYEEEQPFVDSTTSGSTTSNNNAKVSAWKNFCTYMGFDKTYWWCVASMTVLVAILYGIRFLVVYLLRKKRSMLQPAECVAGGPDLNALPDEEAECEKNENDLHPSHVSFFNRLMHKKQKLSEPVASDDEEYDEAEDDSDEDISCQNTDIDKTSCDNGNADEDADNNNQTLTSSADKKDKHIKFSKKYLDAYWSDFDDTLYNRGKDLSKKEDKKDDSSENNQ